MDANEIRLEAISMADRVYEILNLIEYGFIKNKMEFLTTALQEETELNKTERALADKIMSAARNVPDRRPLAALAQIVEMLERMGDEATSLIERIEVKVHERILFSEEAVRQFNETYKAMKSSVQMMREYLRQKDEALKKKVLDNGLRVKELVENYRKEHADRLVRGDCTPMGANMYFDMLDFTGNLARHSSNIVKLG
ncbi:MAG: PhoU domain-containing protein [Candidatus Omnitrophica bacterium]|nr:PhoU domain-containing protein [Candidatus Omnitrophota bacterium]